MEKTDKIYTQMSIDICEKEKDFKFKTYNKDDIKITYFDIKKDNSELNKKKGEYVTFEIEENFIQDEILTKYFTDTVLKLIAKLNLNLNAIKILIIGLGNPYITCDSLGYEVVKNILPTGHIILMEESLEEKINNITCFSPSVAGNTGIESSLIIDSLIKKIKPDLVIYIDSLITDSTKRLSKSLQISNTPLNIDGKILQKDNTKILSIGFPSVINIENNKYTSNDIDIRISRFSKIIADSLNSALNPIIDL